MRFNLGETVFKNMKNKMHVLYGSVMAATWGSSFLFLKNLLGVYSPLEVSFLRYSMTGIFFMMVSWRALKGIRFSFQDLVRLLVATGFGISLYSVLSATSMKFLTSSEAGILNGTIPAITLLVERLIYKQRLLKNQLLAVCISLVGVGFISISNVSIALNPYGIGLMVVPLALWVGYGYAIQPLFDRYNIEAINVFQSLAGAGLLIPFILMEGKGADLLIPLRDWHVMGPLFAVSVLSSGLGYLFYLKCIQLMGIRKLSFYVNLLPVVALVEGAIFMGDLIKRSHLLGIGLILFSVWIIQRNEAPTMAN